MENRANAFGRSTSMPLFQQQDSAQSVESRGRAKPHDTFAPMAPLQAQDSFRNQNASIWSPNGLSNGFLSPPALNNGFQFGHGFGSNGNLQASQLAKGSVDDVKGSAPTDNIPTTPEPRVTVLPEDEVKVMDILLATSSKRKIIANTSVSQGDGQHTGSSDSSSSSEDSVLFKGSNSDLSRNRLPGLGHISSTTDKFSPPKELEVPNGTVHHRRHSSRLSSLPTMPSPLRPRHVTTGMNNDPVSPMPATPAVKSQREIATENDDFPMFGLDIRDPTFDGKPSRFSTKPFGFGHGRKPTDPFVDPADKWSQPLKASPFVTQAQHKFTFPSNPDVQVPSTPMFYAQDFQPLVSSPHGQRPFNWSPGTHQTYGNQAPLSHQSSGQATPSFQGFSNPPTRLDLPIPPPPLAAAQGHLFHSPGARARLDTQANLRGEWIRNEARKIADLSRLSFVAAQRFQQTRTQEDYEIWQRLATAYDDATKLEKRQEERRNMFMPNGMEAMKTGADNLQGDQCAAYVAAAEAGGQADGKLMGFQMAYMERVCAEVKQREEEQEEEEADISMEMLNTLGLDEKKALREHLVARLQNGTAASKAEVLSESFI